MSDEISEKQCLTKNKRQEERRLIRLLTLKFVEQIIIKSLQLNSRHAAIYLPPKSVTYPE